LGWYLSLGDRERAYVQEYLGHPSEEMPWPLIRCALGSRSHLAVLPLQDLLALDGSHRMNVPGTAGDNWNWRFSWDQVRQELSGRLRRLVELYGR